MDEATYKRELSRLEAEVWELKIKYEKLEVNKVDLIVKYNELKAFKERYISESSKEAIEEEELEEKPEEELEDKSKEENEAEKRKKELELKIADLKAKLDELKSKISKLREKENLTEEEKAELEMLVNEYGELESLHAELLKTIEEIHIETSPEKRDGITSTAPIFGGYGMPIGGFSAPVQSAPVIPASTVSPVRTAPATNVVSGTPLVPIKRESFFHKLRERFEAWKNRPIEYLKKPEKDKVLIEEQLSNDESLQRLRFPLARTDTEYFKHIVIRDGKMMYVATKLDYVRDDVKACYKKQEELRSKIFEPGMTEEQRKERVKELLPATAGEKEINTALNSLNIEMRNLDQGERLRYMCAMIAAQESGNLANYFKIDEIANDINLRGEKHELTIDWVKDLGRVTFIESSVDNAEPIVENPVETYVEGKHIEEDTKERDVFVEKSNVGEIEDDEYENPLDMDLGEDIDTEFPIGKPEVKNKENIPPVPFWRKQKKSIDEGTKAEETKAEESKTKKSKTEEVIEGLTGYPPEEYKKKLGPRAIDSRNRRRRVFIPKNRGGHVQGNTRIPERHYTNSGSKYEK